MAIVDLKSSKIQGCKEDSLTWWHEKGHLVYNSSDKGMRNSFMMQSFFEWTVITLIIYMWFNNLFWKIVFTISIIAFVLLYWYEELWCWIYAWKKKGKVYK